MAISLRPVGGQIVMRVLSKVRSENRVEIVVAVPRPESGGEH